MTEITDIKMSGCRRSMARHQPFLLKTDIKVESTQQIAEIIWFEGSQKRSNCYKTALLQQKSTRKNH